jgi:hypothetical protein
MTGNLSSVMRKLLLLPFLTVMATWTVPGSCSQSNIVLIITDDQDLTLGGLVSECVIKGKEKTVM